MLRRFKTVARLLVAFAAVLFIAIPSFAAGTWNYGITDTDTLTVIDESTTNAFIDTVNNEITLPLLPVANLVSFTPQEGIEYLVLTKNGVKAYSYDGSQMVANNLLEVPTMDAVALAAPEPYPTVTVAKEDGLKTYSFSGSGMQEIPAMEISGLTNVISIGSVESGNIAVLDSRGNIKAYSFDGSNMVENTILEPSTTFADPVAVAMTDDYSIAVLEKTQVKYYSFSGRELTENPALSISGLSDAKSFAVTENGIDVVDGTQVKHYSFDGSSMVYNSVLSITSGLSSPKAVAARPGTNDKIIIDGNKARYFQFDGSGYVENENLSVAVSNLVQGDKHADSAVVQSKPVDPGTVADMIRVQAFQELPEGTSITWSVSANGGTSWTTRWRVRGTVSGTVLEVSDDNGLTWTQAGTAADAYPGTNNEALWAEVTPGNSVIWRAVLATANSMVTPKIYASAGAAVRWEANSRPEPPSLDDNTVNGWFYTTTPTFTWNFNDSDIGDSQTAFQLVIKKQSDDSIVFDSGKVIGPNGEYILPTSYNPEVDGTLWAAGTYEFKVEVRTWDSMDCVSEWSETGLFKVLAFERPRIAEIINPPEGQVSPDPADPSTYIMIKPDMDISELPKCKAGARVTMILDGVGPINDNPENIARLIYDSKDATLGEISALNPQGSPTNRYTIRFWTDASLEEVPSGTVVTLLASGTGTEGGTTYFEVPDSDPGDVYAGYESTPGVIITEGTIYEDWIVLMKGRDN